MEQRNEATNAMGHFIKYEVWPGYSSFKPKEEVDLSVLKTLDYVSFRKKEIQIRLEIPEDSQEPTEYQIRTFHYIIDWRFRAT